MSIIERSMEKDPIALSQTSRSGKFLRISIACICIVVFIGAIAIMVFLATNHMRQTNPTVAKKFDEPLPVDVVALEQRTLTEVIGANGKVDPLELLNVTTKVSAKIEKVHVDYGDIVKNGQLLIEFNREVVNATLEAAQSDVARTAADVTRATKQYDRIKSIYSEGLLPQIKLEETEAVLDETRARYRAAQQVLSQATEDIRYAAINSSVNGIITDRLVHPGETPKIGEFLLSIGKIDEVLVEAKVAEENLGAIELQQRATVTFNAFPNEEMQGSVVKIRPVIDRETKTFNVDVKVDNRNLKLKPGLTAFVRFKKTHNTLAVPSITLINPTGLSESTVFVVGKDSVARLRKVKTGVSADGMTAILQGLTEGERVVAVGQLYLKDGNRVRIGDEYNEIKVKS